MPHGSRALPVARPRDANQSLQSMDNLLTVIIPVYKTFSTIDRCIGSVVGQEYRHLEIILVDDGSPDGCPAKCDEWAARDSRIRVIHKPNGGLGDARNSGLDAMNGSYVTFVDSDDFMAAGTLRALMDTLSAHPEYDILEYGVCRFYGSPKQEMLAFADGEYRNIDDYWLEARAYAHAYMWNKVFRRALFDSVRFPPRRAFEDIFTLPQLLGRASCVATTHSGLYYYCMNGGGITATAGGNELRALLDSHMRVIGAYRGKPGFGPYYMHVLNIQLSVSALTGDAPRLTDAPAGPLGVAGASARLKAVALRLLGIGGLCRAYRLFWRACRLVGGSGAVPV